MLARLCPLLCCWIGACLNAQQPTERLPTHAEVAAARGVHVGAEQLQGLDAAERSWLIASRLTGSARARALLDLALERPAWTEHALLAAAFALVEERDTDFDEPSDADTTRDRHEAETELERIENRQGALLTDLERLLSSIAKPRDPAMVDEARELLSQLRLVGDARPLQVRSGTTLVVPAPRSREFELLWIPTNDRGAPISKRIAPGAEPFEVAVPAPGSWRLELRESATGFRATRDVLVSDLGFDALATGSALYVCLHSQSDVPAIVRVFDDRGLTIAEGSTPGSFGAIDLPDRDGVHGERFTIEIEQGSQVARGPVFGLGSPLQLRARRDAHVFVERPLYRPGQRVRGRIVARNVEPTAEDQDDRGGRAHGRVLRNKAATLTLWPRERHSVSVEGRFDALGVFEFAAVVPDDAPMGSVDGELVFAHDDRESLGTIFRVDAFRRSPLIAQLDAPRIPTRDSDAAAALAQLSARWSGGAVAAGSPVRIHARCGKLEQTIDTALDARGRLQIVLPTRGRDASIFDGSDAGIRLETSVIGPDGQPVRSNAYVELPRDTNSNYYPPRIEGPETLRAGTSASFILRGPANSRGLALLRVGANSRAFAAQFDEKGETRVEHALPPDAASIALLDLVASGRHDSQRFSVQIPERQLVIRAHDIQEHDEPGSSCTIGLTVVDGAGAPRQATLSVSLVDERLLALQDVDDAKAIDYFGRIAWHESSRNGYAMPLSGDEIRWQAVGQLLAVGRPIAPLLPRSKGLVSGGPGAPSAGGAAANAAIVGDELLRKDFRPSVGFVPCLRTDEHGRATWRCTLPHDLTTWRLRVVAIDDELGQGAARFPVVTKKPLSVQVATPRMLRVGDRIRTVPAVADLSGSTPALDSWTSTASTEVVVHAGNVIEDGIELTAKATGAARLRTDVRSGDATDALETQLTVLPALVRESRTKAVTARTTSTRVELADVDQFTHLDVSIGTKYLIDELREQLRTYPYRCAEQTSSRMLALYSRTAPSTDGEKLDYESSFARLQSLFDRRTVEFAWWPGHDHDAGMSALVLHALCSLRDSGRDLDTPGFGAKAFERANDRVRAIVSESQDERSTPEAIERLELAIALTRITRSASSAENIARYVAANAGLPRGLLARTAIALADAGCLELAHDIGRRLSKDAAVTMAGFALGEDATVCATFELELLEKLDGKPERIAELRERLTRAAEERGFAHTVVASRLVFVLGRDQGPPSDSLGRTSVEVEIDENKRTIDVDPEHTHVRIELTGTPRILVRTIRGDPARVRLCGSRDRPAATFRAIDHDGISISRSILGTEDGSVVSGRPYVLRFEIRANVAKRYLVVRCPLPAGCEVFDAAHSVDAHDSWMAVALPRLLPAMPQTVDVRVVFGFEGDVLWPPARVFDMYAADAECAYTSGSRLEILPSEAVPLEEASVAVLSFAWRKQRLLDALERAHRTSASSIAIDEIRALDDTRLLDDEDSGSMSTRRAWLARLLDRFPENDDYVDAVLSAFPATSDEATVTPSIANERLYRFAMDERSTRDRCLAADATTFARHVPEAVRQAEPILERAIQDVFFTHGIRSFDGADHPRLQELNDEARLVDALLARFENLDHPAWVSRREPWIFFRDFLESIEEPLDAFGAEISPVEREVRERLFALRRRAQAIAEPELRVWAFANVSDAEERIQDAIDDERWDDVPEDRWPNDLGWISAKTIRWFANHGTKARDYLIDQVRQRGPHRIEDVSCWLEEVVRPRGMNLTALLPLIEDFDDSVPLQRELDACSASSMRAAFDTDRRPLVRLVLLESLHRRKELPPALDDPSVAAYADYWQALAGSDDARARLRSRLADDDTPADYTDVAWRALRPRLTVQEYVDHADDLDEDARRAAFTNLSPAEKRRFLREHSVDALPTVLDESDFVALRAALWNELLQDDAAIKGVLRYFVTSPERFAFAQQQLRSSPHYESRDIAAILFEEYGISAAFGNGTAYRITPASRTSTDAAIRNGLLHGVDVRLLDGRALRHEMQLRGCWLPSR
ncbi:MAG: hypothetical protein H6833_13240 [Planctomycetes bacterium]|nr:hypothetical protein [Planctomycetota bacterium]